MGIGSASARVDEMSRHYRDRDSGLGVKSMQLQQVHVALERIEEGGREFYPASWRLKLEAASRLDSRFKLNQFLVGRLGTPVKTDRLTSHLTYQPD